MEKVKINRDVNEGRYRFYEVFKGFENLSVIKSVFGEKASSALASIQVEIVRSDGFMHVNDDNGSIIVSLPYLRKADERHLYLDVIHELVHVKQFYEGKELYDRKYSYVDRPTEIEAYRVTVEEAKRIGMNYKEIIDYLKVPWVSEEEMMRLINSLNLRVSIEKKGKIKKNLNVNFDR